MNTEQIEALKAAALAATPGPWDFDTAETPTRIAGGEVVGGDALPYGDVYTTREYETPEGPECLIIASEIGAANGRYMRAANPAVILELLASATASEGRIAELTAALQAMFDAHTKHAGLTTEIALDPAQFEKFVNGCDKTVEDAVELARAALAGSATPSAPLANVEVEDGRMYIPLPGGWEVQTKGKGSTFRICHKHGAGENDYRRWMVLDEKLHKPLEAMALAMRNNKPTVAPQDALKNADSGAAGLPAELSKAFITLESSGGGEGRTLVLKFNQREDAYAVHDFLLKGGAA